MTEPCVDAIDLLVDTFRPYGWTDRSIDGYVIALGDLPPDLVRAAVVTAIRTASKMPAPADLRRTVLAEVSGPTLDADSAWAEVRRAFGTHGRTGSPAWSSPIIADTINAIGGWGRMCTTTDETGIRIQFTRSYDRLVQRSERDALVAPAFGELLVGHHIDELDVRASLAPAPRHSIN